MPAEPVGSDATSSSEIPSDGKITMISAGIPLNKEQCAASFLESKTYRKSRLHYEGWTLDVLSAIRRLGKQDFSLKEVYEFESELKALHPRNQKHTA